MSFKFELAKIDPHNCTLEELKNDIARLKDVKEEYFNLEQSIKIFINSIYGGCASPYFVGFNVYVAEAVTLQGQDLIKFTNVCLDNYFLKHWHLDTELHQKLGLTRVNQIQEKSLIIYNDTDSTYMTFKPILDSCDWKTIVKDETEFILKVKDERLNKYLDSCFNKYAEERNTKNLQSLELEKISYSALMIAKKKYILNLAWKDPGVFFDPCSKIKPVGIEIIQGSTPLFARKALKQLLNVLFEKGKQLEYSEIVKLLKEYKKQFILQDPNDIALTKSIGDYEKYILEDKNEIRLESRCPINVRAAGIYNHTLLNSKYKTKYNLLRTSDKLKYYYAKGKTALDSVFGFVPGDYPIEFAFPVDYDLQFSKTIIEPFNRYIYPLGFTPVPGNLVYSKALF